MRSFKSTLSPEENKERMQAYDGGLSDPEAALRFGIKPETFRDWRHRRGLMSTRPFGITHNYQDLLLKILAAHQSGMRIEEIASKFSVKHVRRKLNLARIITQTNMKEDQRRPP